MRIDRRTFLAGGAVGALMAMLKSATAKTLGLFSGSSYGGGNGGGGRDPRLLATLTLQNINARMATPTESYFSFGMAFKKGDVPARNVPQIRRADTNAIIPAQFDMRNSWPDGSLRWCEVSCVGPSITGRGKLRINVLSVSGRYNNTSARSLSDITSNTDLKVVITNCTDSKGTAYNGGSMTASFNTASAASGKTELIKSGPVCDQWRSWMFFPGQQNLACWFYVTAWTNKSNGNLATISHIAKIHNGFINVAGITKLYYDAAYMDGTTTIRNFGGPTTEKQFTYRGSNNELTCANHGFMNGCSVSVRSTGSLPPGNSFSFAANVGTTYFASNIEGALVGFLTTTGTLPSPLSLNRTYYPYGSNGQLWDDPGWSSPSSPITFADAGTGSHSFHHALSDSVNQAPGGVYYVHVIDANTFQLCDMCAGAQSNSNQVPITGAGTGRHYVQPRLFHHHHSSWYTADKDGLLDWTANEATIFVIHDKAYLHSTGLIPPYDMTVVLNPSEPSAQGSSPNWNGITTHWPMSVGDMRAAVTAAGTHPMIGPLPGWCAQAFLATSSAGNVQFAQIARVNALHQCGWNCWINEATGKVPTVIGNANLGASGNYPGLGTNFRDTYWFAQGNRYGSVVDPAGGYGPWFGWGDTTPYDWSHNPDCHHYTIVTEGGAHLIDSQIIYTNGGPWATVLGGVTNDWYGNDGRQQKVTSDSSNFYYGIFNGQARSVGWQLRSFVHTRAIIPDSWPEQAYFDDYLKHNAAWAVEKIKVLPSAMATTGWWGSYWQSYAQWAHSFQARACCHAYFLFGDSNMQTWAQHMIKLFENFATNWRGHCAVAFNALGWYCNNVHAADNRNNYLTMDKVLTFYGTGFNDALAVLPDHTTNSFTAIYSAGYLPFIQFPLRLGDIMQMTLVGHDNSGPYTLPTGLSPGIDYYIYNITGSDRKRTLQLSTTHPINPGPTLATFSDNGSGGNPYFEFGMIPSVCPTLLANLNTNSPLFEALGAVATAAACGFSVPHAYNALHTLAVNNVQTIQTGFPSNPIFAMVNAF
jgi:hypothetical protein